MKVVSIFFVSVFLFSSALFAESYTLQNDQTGKSFYCSDDSSQKPDIPACIKTVSSVCKAAKGSFSEEICFSDAKSHCKIASAEFGQCVTDVYELCNNARGSFSKGICYKEALDTCI